MRSARFLLLGVLWGIMRRWAKAGGQCRSEMRTSGSAVQWVWKPYHRGLISKSADKSDGQPMRSAWVLLHGLLWCIMRHWAKAGGQYRSEMRTSGSAVQWVWKPYHRDQISKSADKSDGQPIRSAR